MLKLAVQIEGLTLSRGRNAALANAEVGLAHTPPGYVWHQVEDGATMQLVPEPVHARTGHSGGIEVIRERLNRDAPR